jgi:hypothetical protein
MSTKLLVALSMALASGATPAQEALSTVEVRAESDRSLTIACDSPSKPSLKDVEHVLAINDPSEAPGLRTKLMGAAAEACAAGEARIQVMRGGSNSLTWKAMR